MLFHKALNKYGIEQFEIEILEIFDKNTNLHEIKILLDNKEKYYIKEKNSYVPNGYNQTYGGDAGVLGLKMTDEQKQKISIASKKQQRNKVYGYNILTKEFFEFDNVDIMEDNVNISKSVIKKICNNHYNNDYCKCFTFAYNKDELTNKIQKLHFDKHEYKNNNALRIKEIDCNGNTIKEYESITILSKECNIPYSTIVGNLSGKTKTCHGRKFAYVDDKHLNNKKIHAVSKNFIQAGIERTHRSVMVYNLKMNPIKQFYTIAEASRFTGVNKQSITKICKFKKHFKTGKGFIFRYVDT